MNKPLHTILFKTVFQDSKCTHSQQAKGDLNHILKHMQDGYTTLSSHYRAETPQENSESENGPLNGLGQAVAPLVYKKTKQKHINIQKETKHFTKHIQCKIVPCQT